MTAAPRKKRALKELETKLPTGSLVRMVGCSWLDHLTGRIALVTGHGYDRYASWCIFLQLSEERLDVPYELMSPGDLELVE